MTIAITGAAGHLGRLTAQLVLDRVPPDEVVLVTRRPDAIADLADAGATVRRGDFDEPDVAAGGLRRRRPPAADQHRRARQPRGPAHRRHRRRGGGRRRPRALHVERQRGQRAAARGLPRARRDRARDPRPRPALDRAAQRPLRRVPGRRGGARRRLGPARRTTTATARPPTSRARTAPPPPRPPSPATATRTASTTSPAPSSSRRRSSPRWCRTSPAAPSRPSPSTTTRPRRTSPPWACRPTRRWPTRRSARPSARACWTSSAPTCEDLTGRAPT